MVSQRCLSVLLQAICAKCSKTLDNKTSRVCPECFEATLSLENFGVSEQKRKAEVRRLKTNKNKNTCTLRKTAQHVPNSFFCLGFCLSNEIRLSLCTSAQCQLNFSCQTALMAIKTKHGSVLIKCSTLSLLNIKVCVVLNHFTYLDFIRAAYV